MLSVLSSNENREAKMPLTAQFLVCIAVVYTSKLIACVLMHFASVAEDGPSTPWMPF